MSIWRLLYLPLLYCLILPMVNECSSASSRGPVRLLARKRRIAGGSEAHAGQYPFAVQILVNGPNSSFKCGGAILSPNFVLTSAHCVDKTARQIESIQVTAGDVMWKWERETGNVRTRDPVQIRHVAHVIPHKEYRIVEGMPRNDIAVLELSAPPLKSTPFVQPIQLPKQDQIFAGSAITMGWGQPEAHFGHLRTVAVPIAKCGELYEKYNYDRNAVICAGGSGRGICTGDSGSPLVCSEGTDQYICGVASFGEGPNCGERPQAFTHVASVTDWISELIKGHNPSNITTTDCDNVGDCGNDKPGQNTTLCTENFECKSGGTIIVVPISSEESGDLLHIAGICVLVILVFEVVLLAALFYTKCRRPRIQSVFPIETVILAGTHSKPSIDV